MFNIVQKFSLSTVAATLISLGNITNPATAATLYNLTDLGTLGGNTSYAYSINNRGQVVGSSLTASGNMQAFIWENGVITGLGTFGGNTSVANDINDLGQVVGYATTNQNNFQFGQLERAFIWDSQVGMQQLAAQEPSRYNIRANHINNQGEIIGFSWFYHVSESLLWKNSIEPGHIFNADNNTAVDINNSGQIIGRKLSPELRTNSTFLWDNNTTIGIAGFGSNVSAINDRGQVIGKTPTVYDRIMHSWSLATQDQKTFIWDQTQGIQYIDLTNAYDINNSGQVVGSSSNRAFIWEKGIATDLNFLLATTSQWQLREAKAINNHGQIVGYGSLDGVDHAFLLTPVSEAVPEPTSIMGIISFGAYCFGSRWQRKNKSS